MTELRSPQLTAEEASRQIAADIRAYPQQPDKREEHFRLFDGLLSHDDIEGAWADRYAEIALAGRGKLADLSSRLGGLRPKIDEAKHILAQPKVFRRFAKKEQSSANTALSFSVPAVQPLADEEARDTPADDDIVEDDLQRVKEAGHKLWRIESALPFVSQSMSEDVGALLWFISRDGQDERTPPAICGSNGLVKRLARGHVPVGSRALRLHTEAPQSASTVLLS